MVLEYGRDPWIWVVCVSICITIDRIALQLIVRALEVAFRVLRVRLEVTLEHHQLLLLLQKVRLKLLEVRQSVLHAALTLLERSFYDFDRFGLRRDHDILIVGLRRWMLVDGWIELTHTRLAGARQL